MLECLFEWQIFVRVVEAVMEMINEKLKKAKDLGKLKHLKKPSIFKKFDVLL